jgi:hypothetical protein
MKGTPQLPPSHRRPGLPIGRIGDSLFLAYGINFSSSGSPSPLFMPSSTSLQYPRWNRSKKDGTIQSIYPVWLTVFLFYSNIGNFKSIQFGVIQGLFFLQQNLSLDG